MTNRDEAMERARGRESRRTILAVGAVLWAVMAWSGLRTVGGMATNGVDTLQAALVVAGIVALAVCGIYVFVLSRRHRTPGDRRGLGPSATPVAQGELGSVAGFEGSPHSEEAGAAPG